MKVLRSYGGGIIDAILEPKMIFVLWLRNFIFGLFIFYLLLRSLSGAMGKTVFAESLSFDVNILFDLLVHHGQSYSMIISAGIILIVLYFLVSVFLYGGILSILTLPPEAREEKRRFAQIFFQGAGKYFGRFFRLSIYSILLWAVFILINLLLNPLGKFLTGDGTNERTAFYLFWIRLAIGLFLVFLIRMILDYSRIEIVILDSRSIFLSLFKAIKFVFQNFGKTLALYYLLVLTGIALISAFWLLKSYLPSFSSPWLTILVPLVVAQLYIFFRAWLKIAFQSAQLVFYIGLSAI